MWASTTRYPSSTHFPVCLGVSLAKLNIRKKGTLIIKGSVGNLVWGTWRPKGLVTTFNSTGLVTLFIIPTGLQVGNFLKNGDPDPNPKPFHPELLTLNRGGGRSRPCGLPVKDFKFVPLMFVTLGFGSQIPLLRTTFHGLGTQTQGYKP